MEIEQAHFVSARNQIEQALILARRLRANNFVAEGLCFLSKISVAEGNNEEARRHIDEAVSVLRDVGLKFFGPLVLANAAHLTEDPEQRRGFLARRRCSPKGLRESQLFLVLSRCDRGCARIRGLG